MNPDDLALGYVLDTLEPDDRARAETAVEADASFAAAVERARADVGDIARGIDLVAAGPGAKAPSRAGQVPRLYRLASIAAAVALLVAGAAVLASRRNAPEPPVTGTTPPTTAHQVPGACTLDTLTGDVAIAIVTGTVTGVRDGSADDDGSGGIDFQIATVAVDETIRGPSNQTIYAFDYTYGVPWVERGQQLLLFLASSADTVHEKIDPAHLQALSGDCGSVPMQEGQLVGVDYTLDDVRARG